MEPIFGILTAGILFAIGAYILVAMRIFPSLPLPDAVRKRKDAATIAALALIAFGLMNGAWMEVQGWAGMATAAVTPGSATEDEDVGSAICPDTQLTDVTIDVQNSENTTGVEEFDVTLTCVSGNSVVSITDTTNPNASHFQCGAEYNCFLTSTSGAAGDSSVVKQILSGVGTIDNGNLKFRASGATQSFQLAVPQHGVMNVRAWDVSNAGWVYNSADATATDYETDGVTFESTTNNSTATALSTGGELHMKFYIRSGADDQVLNDGSNRGLWFLLEAPATEYNVDAAAIVLDGSAMSNNCDGLDAKQQIAYSGYEGCYKYAGDKKFLQTAEGNLDVDLFALSGVDPSTDVQIDIAAVGSTTSTVNANQQRVSSVTDAASPTAIYSLEDITVDIS